jgi:hypothetical protein
VRTSHEKVRYGCRFPAATYVERCQNLLDSRSYPMKYVLMFTSRPDLDAAGDPEERQQTYAAIFGWFQQHASVITDSGAELTGPETATSVKTGENGEIVVVDGPFSEAKESIGGFSVIDVPDLDAAIAIVKEWPALGFPGVAIEIRPMVEDYSQFEETSELDTASKG